MIEAIKRAFRTTHRQTQHQFESQPSDVIAGLLSKDKNSIWSVVMDSNAKDIDPEKLVRFVANRKKQLLDNWVLRATGSPKNYETVGVDELAVAIQAVRNDAIKVRDFCRYARTVEDEIWLERGAEGETILHYALIYQSAKLLNFLLGDGSYAAGSKQGLKAFDRLHLMINTVYEKYNFWGEHACHIAAVVFGDNTKVLKRLIDKGADPFIQRARGTFFDQDEQIGSMFMGETVLAFAAVMGHHRIVDYLIHDVGVDPNMVDYNGNNVLHVLSWYGYVDNKRGIDLPRALSQFNSTDAVEDTVSDTNPELSLDIALEEEEEKEDKVLIKEIVEGDIYHQLESGIRPARFCQPAERDHTETILEHEYHPHRVDDTQSNADRMTPLILAVERSQSRMVEAILKYKSRTIWTYGSTRKVRVSLSELDTYNDTSTMNHSEGALAIAIRNKNVEILNIPAFYALLDSKWNLYAKRIFHYRFWVNVIYMAVFSLSLSLVPNGQSYLDPTSMSTERLFYYTWPVGVKETVRCICEIILLLSNVFLFSELTKQVFLLKGKLFTGFSRHHTIIKYGNFLLFAAIVALRSLRWNQLESIAMTLYATLGWLQILYYFRGFRELGPLSMVFTKIIQNDVYKFLMVAGIVLAGFGSALWLQMSPYGDLNASAVSFNGTIPNLANPDDADWKELIPGGLIWTIRLFFAQGIYDDFRNGSTFQFAIILFMLFFFVVNIILLNVFIGMVNSTFGKVLGEAENQYYLAWASLIMEMDELLLAKYAKKLAKAKGTGLSIPPPITRIGIPRATKIVNPREKKRQAEEKILRKLTAKNKRSSKLGAIGAHPEEKVVKDESELSEYYDYDLYLQFNGNDAKPKRIIASLDPNSPLSEIAHENSLSHTRRFFTVETRRTKGKTSFTTS
ncbi:UNVERIFIED_CONTAM: hypothetical protein HDU68_003256 [Siphonaria sp. JEL0065]|nr:hypothetical protein HDU68_003256 [Siphonaria sp. JEL0065]